MAIEKKQLPKEPADRYAHRMTCKHISMGGSCMKRSGWVSSTCHILMGCTANTHCRRMVIFDNKHGYARDAEYQDYGC